MHMGIQRLLARFNAVAIFLDKELLLVSVYDAQHKK
jgi:hypothetical protein